MSQDPVVSNNTLARKVSSDTAAQAEIRNTEKWPHDYLLYVACAVLSTAMLSYAAWDEWGQLEIKNNIPVGTVLGTLLLVSLFVERAIEVFVAVWIDRKSAIHEQNLAFWQARQGQLKNDIASLIFERNSTSPQPDPARITAIDALLSVRRAAVDEAVNLADGESKALLPFKVRTSKVSTLVGLVIGVMVSAAGFRFLAQLVNIDASSSDVQDAAFVVADVLLTGTVLGGGSKLIHEIFAVYSSFMDSTKKSLSDQSKTQ